MRGAVMVTVAVGALLLAGCGVGEAGPAGSASAVAPTLPAAVTEVVPSQESARSSAVPTTAASSQTAAPSVTTTPPTTSAPAATSASSAVPPATTEFVAMCPYDDGSGVVVNLPCNDPRVTASPTSAGTEPAAITCDTPCTTTGCEQYKDTVLNC